MKKHVLIKISGIVFLVVVILGFIMGTTEMPNEKDNGFERRWFNNRLVPAFNNKFINTPLSKISGVSEKSIFIAGENLQGVLILSKDFEKRDTLLLNLPIPPTLMVPFSLYVDTPMLYLHVNNTKSIVYGKFPKEDLLMKQLDINIFSKSIQISPKSVVLRVIDSSQTNQVFKKIDVESGMTLAKSNVANLGDNAGGVSTDGVLLYDKSNSLIFYVESFRNRFYCMDTSLSLVYEAKTIDTITHNTISLKVQTINDTVGKLVPNSARIQVNKDAFIDNSRLFIVSALRADNQSMKEFNKVNNIDVYRISNGEYLGSFRLGKEVDSEYKSAIIYGDTLSVLYKNVIKSYILPM